jgi:hypothetical protein
MPHITSTRRIQQGSALSLKDNGNLQSALNRNRIWLSEKPSRLRGVRRPNLEPHDAGFRMTLHLHRWRSPVYLL